MSHQRRAEQTSKYTDTHPLSPSTFDPVLDLLLLAPAPLISLPASLYTFESRLPRLLSESPASKRAEQREIGQGQPQSTVPYLPAAVEKPTLPYIPSLSTGRVESIPTQSNPVQSTATFNSQSFVSSGRQCRQCRHQCNHPPARLLTLPAACCALPFIITYLHCMRACRVQSGQVQQPALLCSAWRPFRIRCATADPPCCCLWLLLLLLLLIATRSRCSLPLSLLLPSLLARPAPTIWDLGLGTWDLELGPGTSHLESFV